MRLQGKTLKVCIDIDAQDVASIFCVDNSVVEGIVNSYNGVPVTDVVKSIITSDDIPDNYKACALITIGAFLNHMMVSRTSTESRKVDMNELFKDGKLH